MLNPLFREEQSYLCKPMFRLILHFIILTLTVIFQASSLRHNIKIMKRIYKITILAGALIAGALSSVSCDSSSGSGQPDYNILSVRYDATELRAHSVDPASMPAVLAENDEFAFVLGVHPTVTDTSAPDPLAENQIINVDKQGKIDDILANYSRTAADRAALDTNEFLSEVTFQNTISTNVGSTFTAANVVNLQNALRIDPATVDDPWTVAELDNIVAAFKGVGIRAYHDGTDVFVIIRRIINFTPTSDNAQITASMEIEGAYTIDEVAQKVEFGYNFTGGGGFGPEVITSTYYDVKFAGEATTEVENGRFVLTLSTLGVAP